MRVQIPYNEVKPLIKEGYEKVYDAMGRLLAPEEMIFAKWEAGFGGILQWTLPKDYTWHCFTQADDYDKQAIINEFMRLKELGEKKLGTNENLKKAVYSIPSEASVYYTITPEGKYIVMLTGWGYSFPTKSPVTDMTWFLPPASQDTTARFIENGVPMTNLPINLHRNNSVIHHALNENGEKYFGKLTPGTELYIEVPSLSRRVTLTIVPGQTVYTFDMTVAEQPKPVAPEPAPAVVEEPEEPEEIVCDRTFKIQFVGTDGKVIVNRNVTFTCNGVTTEATTDEAGCVMLPGNGIADGSIITAHINDAPQMPSYVDANIVVEAEENEYAIIYKERKKSNVWLPILLGIVAAALAYVTIWGAVALPIN